jgi:hypothetical protein
MSSTDRQNRLLVAEDWKKIYQSFRNADFQSYDFENLRRTMITYIRQNYPEDYNDYIESSEYLALIDLIAFLGQSIAFRVDLNARENFLELAERRESVLRLARLLSYNAKRNQAGNGLLKFSSIKTTQTVIDSNGRNLAGQVIVWNDPANTNWYEQFIKVLNVALPQARQFGNPDDKATIAGIPTQQYRFQSNNLDVPVYGFTKPVDGRSMSFEIVSTVFKDEDYIYEEAPSVGNHLAFLYRDDGRGAASPTSGFFLHFRQGTLNQGSFTVTQPSNNESVDIDAVNINESDVWLYRLDKNGLESEQWAKVPSFEGNNVIYNSLKKNIKNIYGAVTRAGDRISLVFSDGTFGNLPLGTFRTYYRISNGITYTINPKDVKGVAIDVPYVSNVGQIETLTITMGLHTSVSNSSATESSNDIKTKAPQTYYTQNRMITGEDYNISPLSVSQDVAKVKASNRSSSGISRYFDLVDPTGKYSSTNLFADDGIIYREEFTEDFRFNFATRTDIKAVIYNQVLDVLKKDTLRDYYYSKFDIVTTVGLNVAWNQVTKDTNESTGYFYSTLDSTDLKKVGGYVVNTLRYVETGSLLKIEAPAGYYFQQDSNNELKLGTPIGLNTTTILWATVVGVSGDGTAAGTGVLSTGLGPIVLNIPVPGSKITGVSPLLTQIIPKWRSTLEDGTIATMIDLIFANKPFGLRYSTSTRTWQIIFDTNLDQQSAFSLGKQGDFTNQQLDSSWLLLFTTDNEYYTVNSRQLRYVFESDKKLRFYFDKTNKIYDSRTNLIVKDQIKILGINTQPYPSTSPFTTDILWEISSDFKGLDGYKDTKKIEITFADANDDGIVDNPELFINLVQPDVNPTTKYIVLEKYTIEAGQEDYRYIENDAVVGPVIILASETNLNSLISYTDGQYFYFTNTDVVKKLNLTTAKLIASLDYKVYKGRGGIKFQYVHSADYETRIDPSLSNIIDVHVLTKTYDTEFRQWLLGSRTFEPLPPSSDALYTILAPSLNLIKSISDEIIYHPVNYKILFGSKASTDLQAIFKITKNSAQPTSDNEVKARVVVSINEFFTVENWNFGDTFYFSELATYVMNNLAPLITNFVIVPRASGLNFGSLYEIKSEVDQIFINGATVDDIEIISGITSSTIRTPGNAAVPLTALSQQNITSSSSGV